KTLACAGIGIVGARAATEYGKRVSKNMAARLAGKGLTVISGLALGIDTAAHKGALAAGGKTIGVLGCGIDVVYPRQNVRLFREISESGAIVTEYPMGTKPEGYHFPARNRIISGLSLGVTVVEAARKSGSLITAQLALDQGRDVFAIPGRVDSSKSEGVHRLLQDGAKLVQSVDDIIEELNPGLLGENFNTPEIGPNNKDFLQGLDAEAKLIYSFLDVYPKTIDEIIRGAGLTAQKVSELLLTMELKGLVAALPGNQYQKVVDK
ncbi:MAG: DNA-processing protein DprA, partial [Desulfobulbaceae bacterium]|nr:DNA-processing protein DprA [Desulfobulbaceae bacterium]